MVAVHALLPGRPLTIEDIKPAPIVLRDQKVNLVYAQGAVKLTLMGRALQAGAVGDIIPVSVDMGKEKRFKGTIQSNGIVQLIL
jgi:flagella basal body P-ring formation protein FlgA